MPCLLLEIPTAVFPQNVMFKKGAKNLFILILAVKTNKLNLDSRIEKKEKRTSTKMPRL